MKCNIKNLCKCNNIKNMKIKEIIIIEKKIKVITVWIIIIYGKL